MPYQLNIYLMFQKLFVTYFSQNNTKLDKLHLHFMNRKFLTCHKITSYIYTYIYLLYMYFTTYYMFPVNFKFLIFQFIST